MNALQLFLPCAAGVEDFLADEVHRLTGLAGDDLLVARGGVEVHASWRDAMRLNLHSRLAQRVLVQLSHTPYRNENDLYEAASAVAWEIWFTTKQTFKIEVTAQHSPLSSLNFAALKIKDAVADRFRHKSGERPDVDTTFPDVRIYAHLTTDQCTLYIDSSGEALFKRGWRQDKGDAPLKETLAAAMIEASGWGAAVRASGPEAQGVMPLYDPCCGSGTIAIEAAQLACNIAPGLLRRFGFEKLLPFQPHVWAAIKKEAENDRRPGATIIFGSDVAHRMVDFAQRNAQRAGVGDVVQLRGGDALQRLPPSDTPGVMLVNPPYGERIAAAGIAGAGRFGARESAQTDDGGDFFNQLAAHWKKNYPGWTAWVLTPDLKLPSRMRLKESRRVPMWNGPIECRLFKFEMVKGSARHRAPMQPLVLDTNIVLDLFVFGDASARPVLPGLEQGRLQWLASRAMRDELARVLAYPKMLPQLAFYGLDAAQVLARFDRHARLVEAPAKAPVTCADAGDQKFIDLAVAHGALLLSKDRHLLSMEKRLAALAVRVQHAMELSAGTAA